MGFVIFVFWVGLTIATGYFAISRGRSVIGWGLFALLFSPLLAFIIIAILPDIAMQEVEFSNFTTI